MSFFTLTVTSANHSFFGISTLVTRPTGMPSRLTTDCGTRSRMFENWIL